MRLKPDPSVQPSEESLKTILLNTIFIMQENIDTLDKMKIVLIGEDKVNPIKFEYEGLPIKQLANMLREMALYQQSEIRHIFEELTHD